MPCLYLFSRLGEHFALLLAPADRAVALIAYKSPEFGQLWRERE
jgi:hypothetical protein